MMHHYNDGAPFTGIAIDIAGSSLESNEGNQYILIANQRYMLTLTEASTVVDVLLMNFSAALGSQENCKVTG